MNDAPIGVFDSGIGGLTVAKAMMASLPEESILYFADTARFPYGEKTPDTIRSYAAQIIRFLKSRGAKAVAIACNTATAHALKFAQDRFDLPVIGIIKPGARAACEATKNRRVGVIATQGTVDSGIYIDEIHQLDPGIEVVQQACPPFVTYAEQGRWYDKEVKDMIKDYLGVIKEFDSDTLVLGCSHFPLLKDAIAEEMGERVQLIYPEFEMMHELTGILREKGLLASGTVPEYRYFTSAEEEYSNAPACRALGRDDIRFERIEIDRY